MKRPGRIFIISGFSGVGKTTLVDAFIKKYNNKIPCLRVVTYTSRVPRLGEISGIDYVFISSLDFETKIKAGFFFEYSNLYGNFYGISNESLQKKEEGIFLFLVIDYYGAKNIKKKYEDSVLIWIDTTRRELLQNRLQKRNEQEKIIKERRQIEQDLEKDSAIKAIYTYHIQNDLFTNALKQLYDIVSSYDEKK